MGTNKCLPFRCGGPGVATPFVYFKYKILRSDAFFGSENGHYQCFYQDPYAALGEMKTVGRGCRMRPEGPKNEAEGAMDIVFLGEGTASPTSYGAWQ